MTHFVGKSSYSSKRVRKKPKVLTQSGHCTQKFDMIKLSDMHQNACHVHDGETNRTLTYSTRVTHVISILASFTRLSTQLFTSLFCWLIVLRPEVIWTFHHSS